MTWAEVSIDWFRLTTNDEVHQNVLSDKARSPVTSAVHRLAEALLWLWGCSRMLVLLVSEYSYYRRQGIHNIHYKIPGWTRSFDFEYNLIL